VYGIKTERKKRRIRLLVSFFFSFFTFVEILSILKLSFGCQVFTVFFAVFTGRAGRVQIFLTKIGHVSCAVRVSTIGLLPAVFLVFIY
jgi:hypothetical protein